MNNHKVINLFPVPIIQIEFDKHHEYYFEDIEKIVNLPEGWEVSVNSTFPKILDNDKFISPIIRDSLIIDLTKCIKNVFESLKIPSNIYMDNFWYNIYHDNQGQEIHDHLGDVGTEISFWSGIYYNKNASSTTFVRPDKIYKTQLFDNCEDSIIAESYFSKYHTEVKDGDIVLFPPYLDHYVNSQDWHENNMRLTFAFNLNTFKK
jgi:hypothetical protein